MYRRGQPDISCRKHGKQVKAADANWRLLNLKYSSIRHLIRYTFVTIWHRRFFSCILRLLKSSIGSVPNPYTATRTSSFAGNSHSLTGIQLILHWTRLPLLFLKSMRYERYIHDVVGLPVVDDIPVLFGTVDKTFPAF